MSNPSGLCKCGCGGATRLSHQDNRRWGHVKGQPRDHLEAVTQSENVLRGYRARAVAA